MEYEITQIIRYLVKADTKEEAVEKWNNNPRTGVVEWSDDDITLFDEEIDIN